MLPRISCVECHPEILSATKDPTDDPARTRDSFPLVEPRVRTGSSSFLLRMTGAFNWKRSAIFECAHRRQLGRGVDAEVEGLNVEQPARYFCGDDLATVDQSLPGIGRHRHQPRHRPTVVGDFEGFAGLDSFQVAAGLLAQVADTDPLHRATA